MTEIYIVKQIDNSRLTKEVDYQRTKECLLLMLLGFFCLLLFLFLAWQHFKTLRQGYENQILRHEMTQIAEVNHQLKLERAYLRGPQRIDFIAKAKLGLVAPSYEQIVVLSEPFPTEPATTMLARSEGVSLYPSLVKQHLVH